MSRTYCLLKITKFGLSQIAPLPYRPFGRERMAIVLTYEADGYVVDFIDGTY